MRFGLLYGAFALFILLWILSYTPYKQGAVKEIQPSIRLEKFYYVELTTNGERLAMRGQWGNYQNEVFEVAKPLLKDPKKNDSLRADFATYINNLLRLQGDILYVSPNYRFSSQRALYKLKQAKLIVPTPFTLQGKRVSVVGKRLYYDKRSGKIEALDIDAKVLVE